MNKRLQTLLLSLLMPGLGYLHIGDKKSFCKTVVVFFSIMALGIAARLVTNFQGLRFLVVALILVYVIAAIHASFKAKKKQRQQCTSSPLKLCFTVLFFLITGFSFANRRAVMGFDVLSMDVSVMRPTLLPTERFLVDTWAYKYKLPERGDIVAHTFSGQQGLYLNRIIAVENDKVEIKNGAVWLNGKKIVEPYVLPANVTKPQSKNTTPFVVPKGNYFVMGDNRDASFGDSRFSGTITIQNIVGKATDVISSPDGARLGKTLN